jgi:hypothetical protein
LPDGDAQIHVVAEIKDFVTEAEAVAESQWSAQSATNFMAIPLMQ